MAIFSWQFLYVDLFIAIRESFDCMKIQDILSKRRNVFGVVSSFGIQVLGLVVESQNEQNEKGHFEPDKIHKDWTKKREPFK